MSTVLEVVRRLLPLGSMKQEGEGPCAVGWAVPPVWPPDLFAVAATLVNLSGCYAHPSMINCEIEGPRALALRAHGRTWRDLANHDDEALVVELQRLWNVLLSNGHSTVIQTSSGQCPEWARAALQLMAIADEGCLGIGFVDYSYANKALFKNWTRHEERLPPAVRRATATLCELVPPEVCCVQPKMRTPQVGCTLRSLSHHVALLPPMGEVTTRYLVNPAAVEAQAIGSLNILIVPYPFRIASDIFKAREGAPSSFGMFDLDQSWLPTLGDGTAKAPLARMALAMIEQASTELRARARVAFDKLLEKEGAHKAWSEEQKETAFLHDVDEECYRLHGLVFPELALNQIHARVLADVLAKTDLEFFVTGVSDQAEKPCYGRNLVRSFLFSGPNTVTNWSQAKHHRWKLERNQIERYGFDSLDPAKYWWEGIDVWNREVVVYAFRDGATLATLVCEDLARVDPVQPLLRAMGPNLLIALLMDGPQLEWRWPGRYATGLAEDPGTSVLTVTSLGSVDRWLEGEKEAKREALRSIALWKDSYGRAKELLLPYGAHGVVLQLDMKCVQEYTLDGRSDDGGAVSVHHVGDFAVALPRESVTDCQNDPPALE